MFQFSYWKSIRILLPSDYSHWNSNGISSSDRYLFFVCKSVDRRILCKVLRQGLDINKKILKFIWYSEKATNEITHFGFERLEFLLHCVNLVTPSLITSY